MTGLPPSSTGPDPDTDPEDIQYRQRDGPEFPGDPSLITIRKGTKVTFHRIGEQDAWISDENPIDLTEAL